MVAKKKDVCVKAAAKKVASVTLDAMDRGVLSPRKGVSVDAAHSARVIKLTRKMRRYATEAHTTRDVSRAKVLEDAAKELEGLFDGLIEQKREVRLLKRLILKIDAAMGEVKEAAEIDQPSASVHLKEWDGKGPFPGAF